MNSGSRVSHVRQAAFKPLGSCSPLISLGLLYLSPYHAGPMTFSHWRVLHFFHIPWFNGYMALFLGITFKLFLKQCRITQADLTTHLPTALRMSLAMGQFPFQSKPVQHYCICHGNTMLRQLLPLEIEVLLVGLVAGVHLIVTLSRLQ